MDFSELLKKIGISSKPTSVVGVDIGSSSIKVAQLKKEKGIAKLETYGELALGPYGGMAVGQAVSLPSEKIVEAMKDLFAQVNVTTTEAALSVPLKSSLLTLIEIPKIDEKNIDQVVQLEARKYIPVPVSEVMLDYMVIPQTEFESGGTEKTENPELKKIEKMEVLVVAIHKNIISEYEEIIKKAGLKAEPLEIETFAASRAILGNEVNAIAILDIGATASRLLIMDYGVIRISRIINKGSQEISIALQKSLGLSFAEAEEAKRRLGAIGETEGGDLAKVVNPTLEYIFYETRKTLLGYQKKYSRAISKVVLVGGGAQLKGIVDLAKKNLEMDVELGNAFKKTQVPAIAEAPLAENGSGFTIAVGLALRGLQD